MPFPGDLPDHVVKNDLFFWDGTALRRIPKGTSSQILGWDATTGAPEPVTLASLNIDAGTYSPTLTNVGNIDASTAYDAQYLRVGATVFVSGKVDVNPTTPAALTQLGISLPIASNIGAFEDVGGAAACNAIAGQSAAIIGDPTNNRAEMDWIAGDVTNQAMFFSFGYQVI